MQYNLNINLYTNKEEISKQVLQIKPPAKDGLFLQVQNTVEKGALKQVRRFIHLCFNRQENVLVTSDHTGNIVVIDLEREKFWVLPAISLCTVLKFSAYNAGEVILGVQTGALYIINIDTCDITGELLCHNYPVVDVSFSLPYICLSASRKEAVIWDLRSNSKIQVLSLLDDCILKHVMFTPIVGDILACFDDNSIVVWKYGTYEVSQEIQSKSLQSIKSITFTRNGRAMVLADRLSQLTIFMIDTWAASHTLTLPEYIMSIRKIAFIPQPFDGGANKVLGILSGGGVLYFYNMETEEILNKISNKAEILKFDCSGDGKYVSCLLHSGECCIYSTIKYTRTKTNSRSAQRVPKSRDSVIQKKKSELANIQKQMNEYLATDRLVAILKEYGEYPDSYRLKIWAQLLQLPNNKKQYNNFINHGSPAPFENLHLDNKLALLSLKKLLSNLITWCPHFAHVTYMPVFVFPFIKIFQNEPIVCFEAVCSIICKLYHKLIRKLAIIILSF
uniref:WD repeat-containing protein 67 n=1 Tax=Photinus pyralis TaxID=7054 RepID=A0A1Y1KEH7_PHOPY